MGDANNIAKCQSGMIKNGSLIHGTMWMNLKKPLLSKENQIQKSYVIQFHIY